jgi:multidrug efflux pump subunit AcrB
MGGIVGRLFREFAVTVTMAIMVSAFVSLTLTPMLCARFLRDRYEVRHGDSIVAPRRSSTGCSAATIAASHGCSATSRSARCVAADDRSHDVSVYRDPQRFLPAAGYRPDHRHLRGGAGHSFAAMMETQQALAAVIARDPDIASFASSVGPSGGSPGENTGRFFITLKPHNQRQASADEIINRCGRSWRRSRAWRSSCRHRRTSMSAAGSAAHSISTPCRTPTCAS